MEANNQRGNDFIDEMVDVDQLTEEQGITPVVLYLDFRSLSQEERSHLANVLLGYFRAGKSIEFKNFLTNYDTGTDKPATIVWALTRNLSRAFKIVTDYDYKNYITPLSFD